MFASCTAALLWTASLSTLHHYYVELDWKGSSTTALSHCLMGADWFLLRKRTLVISLAAGQLEFSMYRDWRFTLASLIVSSLMLGSWIDCFFPESVCEGFFKKFLRYSFFIIFLISYQIISYHIISYRIITYGPHKAVAEVSNHNEPIGRKSGIQLVRKIRKSMDFTFSCFVLN